MMEDEFLKKISLLSFEERTYRIIKSFYMWQKDMTLDDMDDEKTRLLGNFCEWLYHPCHEEQKRKILLRVEEELGDSVKDCKIPSPDKYEIYYDCKE